MPSIETIRRITVQQSSTGGPAVQADLMATAKAANAVGAALSDLVVTTDSSANRSLSAGPRFRQLAQQLDVQTKAAAALERGMKNATLYLAQNGDQADAVAVQMARLNAVYEETLRKSAGLTAAQKSQAKAAMEAAEAQAQAAAAYQKGLNARLGVGSSGSGSDRQADFEAAVEAANKERAALVPLAAAISQYEEVQKRANANLAIGNITQDEHTAAIGRAKNTLLAQTNEIRKADEANARMAKGVGLSAYGWQNLSFQINDVVTSLSSGISPMQTLAQQGGQIFQVLQGGQGGVKGALQGIGEAAMRLALRIGPVGGVIGGVTTAVLAGVVAQQSYASTQTALAQNLAGVGRASGATAAQINAVASASAAAGGVSVRSAREMAGEFAATGKIGTEMYGGLIGTVKDYAATTGQDVPSATKALAEAFADPAKGADVLDKQLGVLNDTTRENIQRLAAQGDRLGAQKALLDAYRTGLTSATELTSAWGRTTAAVGATISDAWDKIGGAVDKVVTGGTIDEQLAKAQEVLRNSQSRQSGIFGSIVPGIAGDDVRIAQAEVARLQGEIQKRDERNRVAQQNATSTRIGELVKALNPFSEQLKRIDDQAKDIATSLSKLPLDEQGNARRAMEGLLAQAKQLRADMEAGGASYADAIRAAQFQQRTVGFTPQGLSAAQINENAANKRLDAFRNASTNSDQGSFEKQIASIETERKTLLDALEKNTTLQQNQIGGAFSRMSAGVQAQIIAAGNQFGKVPAALIAGIADKESGGKANIGFSRSLGENGKPSSAFGLGQITEGTAKEAIKNGYLPQGYDRADQATMAQGIAGVLQMKIDQAGGDQFKGLKAYFGSKSDAANTAYANDVLRRAGQMGDPSTQAQGRDVDTYNRALRDQKELLANSVENYGKNGLALEANAEATRRYNALLDAGVPANEALAASIRGLATQTATAAQQMKLTQFASDTGFQREQLGRSAPAAAAYSQARSLVGDTNSAGAQFVIAEAQTLDALKQAKDVSSGAFSGIITDLSHGTSVANSFASALSRIGDKLISIGTDALFSSAFGSLLGGGSKGGALGGAGSGAGLGSIFSWLTGSSSFIGFAGGGYTGDGGKYQPAGIVHAGEYVMPAHTVRQYGRGFFDGLRGYADGGFVDIADTRAPITPVPAVAANDQGGPQRGGDVYQIDARGSTLTQAEMTSAVQRAIAANNAERDRTSKERSEELRRAAL